MPDGKKHQPTIALIDWRDPAANRWEVTEELRVLSDPGHAPPRARRGVLRQRPAAGDHRGQAARKRQHARKSMVDEGISQHLRNQRNEEIPQLFAYAQLLLAVSHTEGRYGTTFTAAKFWSRWREEEFTDSQVAEWKNRKLDAATHAALFAGKPPKLRDYFERLWSEPMLPTEQDRLLVGLLKPERAARIPALLRAVRSQGRQGGGALPAVLRHPGADPRASASAGPMAGAKAASSGTPRVRARATPWSSSPRRWCCIDSLQGLPRGGGDRPARPGRPARAQLHQQRRVRLGHRHPEGGREGQGEHGPRPGPPHRQAAPSASSSR